MALYTIDYEGGTAGQIPSASHSNETHPNPAPSSTSTSGTVVYDATHVAHGSMALRQSPPPSSISYISYGNSSSKNFFASALAIRAYFYFTEVPTGGYISVFNNTDAWVAGLTFGSSGQITVRDAAANPLLTGTVPIPVNQWVRLELYVTAGTGNATVTGAAYAGESTTPIELLTSSSATTSAILSSVRVGKNNYNPYNTPNWLDSLAIDTEATGLLGPLVGEKDTPYRIWNGSEYQKVDVRLWGGSAYDSVTKG